MGFQYIPATAATTKAFCDHCKNYGNVVREMIANDFRTVYFDSKKVPDEYRFASRNDGSNLVFIMDWKSGEETYPYHICGHCIDRFRGVIRYSTKDAA